MITSFFIAKRYFLSKNTKNVINIISWISMIGIALGTMSLVVILSVFNGFKDLIKSLYVSFDPDLKIEIVQGKNFFIPEEKIAELKNINGIKYVIKSVEDHALLKYNDQQKVVRIKGVDDDFIEVSGIRNHIISGDFFIKDADNQNFAIVGQGVQNELNIVLNNQFSRMQLWYPKNLKTVNVLPENSFIQKKIQPSGIFTIEKQYDEHYVIVPLRFAQELFSDTLTISNLEIFLYPEIRLSVVKKKIQEILGSDFKISDRYEQHKSLFTILNIEKFAIFLILALIILIASFNIYSSLTMLVLDKKKDIKILNAMGSDGNLIKKIFILEGCLISFSGAITGLILGIIVCLIQKEFGMVSIGNMSLIIDAYPIKMLPLDFLWVTLLIILITFFASLGPASKANRIT